MWRFTVVAMSLCLVSMAQAADVVVVRSNSVEYPKGTLLDSHTAVNLPAGKEMTVVFSSGQVQTFKNAYEGSLQDNSGKAATVGLVDTLASLINTAQPITRGHDIPQDVWLVDISNNKRFYCVAANEHVTLWRPDSESKTASTLQIKHKPTGQQAQVVWPANKSTIEWPSNMPVVYGDTYTLELSSLRGHSTFKKLVLYQLPDSLPSKSHQVVWMAGKGCIPQANLLLVNLR
ncbi:MAG: hypothetical protein PHP00_05385 [Thiotrichaceae bacterium]|nr:hypothetical protein [Thiotrichaceae bacterium]